MRVERSGKRGQHAGTHDRAGCRKDVYLLPTMIEPEFYEVDHTADWAIRVWARDLPKLFASAARGMFSLLTDLSQVAADRAFEIDLQAIDTETLLIDWLNELLYLAEEHGLVFTDFAVSELTDSHLRASARGGRPAELFKVIKAATFNNLSIKHSTEGFEAEIVFDV